MKTILKLLSLILLVNISFSCSKNDDKIEPIAPKVVTDVYVVGYESNGVIEIAKLWKNGLEIPLGDESNYSNAYSLLFRILMNTLLEPLIMEQIQ